jgi:hypothetical protein
MVHNRVRSFTDIAVRLRGVDETFVNGVLNGTPSVLTHAKDDYGWMHDRLNGIYMVTHDQRDPVRARRLAKKLDGLDMGNPMDSIKIVHDYPLAGTAAGNLPTAFVHRRYNGPVIANAPSQVPNLGKTEAQLLSYVDSDSDLELFSLGATAIARCKPASPEAAFGTSLIETYREGIPHLLSDLDIKDAVDLLRHQGSNYLNISFGWMPLVADIQAVAKSLKNQEQILQQLIRNNQRPVKRSYRFPEEKSLEVVDYTGRFPYPGLTTSHWSQQGCVLEIRRSKKTWFEGEFQYRLPRLDNSLAGLKAKSRALLGLDLTPETLWNIAPWMWLSDWFANFGDTIANVTAMSEDDLVLRWGYLMQETITEYKTIHTGVKTLGYGYVTPTITGTTTVTRRVRRKASPYGFGLTDSQLTSRQWAILGALGITRGLAK